MSEEPVIGSNASSGGGGAPSGAAGGELAGTYPNPTVKDAVIDDANIVAGGLTNAALAAAAGIVNTKLATNPLARANHTGTQTMSTISDAGTLATLSAVASAQITDGTIVTGDIAPATIRESNFNTAEWNATDLGFKAWTADPFYATANPTYTSKTAYVSKLKVPVATTCTAINVCINTIGSTLTTIATATVNGLQTAPGSGAWTLTTSSMSGYSAAGIATIGSTIVAYSAWSGTSMTVQAGGYTPGATFSNGATITANSNCVALFDSTGAFLGACVDQTASGFVGSAVYTTLTMIPATPALAAGTCYAAYIGTGTTPAKMQSYATTNGCNNPGPSGLLTGANARCGTAGTGQNSMPSGFTPSAIAATTVGAWFGLG